METTGEAIPEKAPGAKQDFAPWKSRIAASEKVREQLLTKWRENVEYRVQRPRGGTMADTLTSDDRLALPEDWARSKQKAAQLNYQLPKIVAKPKHPDFVAKAPVVTSDVNDVLRNECHASHMVDECLADVINASGVMVSKIGIERLTEDVEIEVPAPPDVDALGKIVPSAKPPVKRKVPKIVSQRFYWDRISPADFLWPAEFRGSDWDRAPWLGIQSWMTVEQAKKTYKDKLPPDFKSEGRKPESLTRDLNDLYPNPENYVRVTEVWYFAWLYDADKVHPECVRRLTFVDGHDQPVEEGQTDWQEWIPEVPPGVGPDGQPTPGRPGYYKGLRRLPIRVETLTYVSDMAIPPSDSEAGRPPVRELIKSRSQMIRQRDHSVPMRWYDTNRLDPDVQEQMRLGEWQGMIPVNGDGGRMIGEVARASYPRENWEFHRVIGSDLDRAWSLSNNQLSTLNPGQRSATEVSVVQNAGQVRLDYEKWRVNRYLVSGAEVLFSLMQKFRNGTKWVEVPTPQGEVLQQINPNDLLGEFMFDFVADSSDRIDLSARQENVLKLYNLGANDPSINRPELLKEMVILHGLDPAKIIMPPPEPKPPAPNVSYRFSGEDLLNPMAVAVMVKSNEITPEEIKAAAMMIKDSLAQIQTVQPAPAMPGAPALPPQTPEQPKVEPPTTVEPILKRAVDGSRF